MRYGLDKIQKLQKTSTTVVTLPSGSIITIGGQRKVITSALTVNTSVSGLGGMESAVAVNTFYYVYAVLNAGAINLIATTSIIKPIAYLAYKKVGAFFVENGVEVFEVRPFGADIVGESVSFDFNYGGSTMSVAVNNFGHYKMIEGGVEMEGTASIPTVNSNTAYLVLPRGLLKDATIFNDSDLGRVIRVNVSENTNAFFMAISGSTGDDKMYLTRVASTISNPVSTQNWNSYFASGNSFTYRLKVRVNGWPNEIDWNDY